MRGAVLAAALVAVGLTGKSAFASHACGPWGGNEVRCIGNNGISKDTPFGIQSRDYTMSITPSVADSFRMRVDIWISTCGFPGVRVGVFPISSLKTSAPVNLGGHAGHYQCVEFFIRDCESPLGTYKSCEDAVHATIDGK
jgi:hypothetical protein